MGLCDILVLVDIAFNEKKINIFEKVHFCSSSQMPSVAPYTDDLESVGKCMLYTVV